jgi:hypothetical protein
MACLNVPRYGVLRQVETPPERRRAMDARRDPVCSEHPNLLEGFLAQTAENMN